MVTPEQEQLQKLISGMMMSGMQGGITPYGGPVGSQPDQLQLGGADIMAKLMGQGGYQMPGFIGMQSPPPAQGAGQAPARGMPQPGPGQGQGMDAMRRRYTPQGY